MDEPRWKRFEKLIHKIHMQLAPQGAVVTLDDKIIGNESKVERQLVGESDCAGSATSHSAKSEKIAMNQRRLCA